MLRKNRQLVSDPVRGDCFRACVTSVLGIENSEDLPNVDDPKWFGKWKKLLSSWGIEMVYDTKKIWLDGYWIATVPSLNFPKTTHAIVMKDTKIAHDPNLKKRYRVGEDLLGTSKVEGGYWFVIADMSKFRKFTSTLKNQ